MQSDQFQLHADIEQRHWWFLGRRAIMRRLVGELLVPSPQTTIVDVGCGTGANIAALADYYDCVGIDTSSEAIHLAQSRFPQVRFLAGRAPDDLAELTRQTRLYLLMDVLEHVEDDVGMLTRLVEASEPGSYFLVTVPADPRLWSTHDESFGHYRRYEEASFRQIWADLPVSSLMVSYFNARLFPLIRLIRAYNRRRQQASGTAGTDFWLPSPPVNRLLRGLFSGEARRLLDVMHGRRSGYHHGASLVAILRREEGSASADR